MIFACTIHSPAFFKDKVTVRYRQSTFTECYAIVKKEVKIYTPKLNQWPERIIKEGLELTKDKLITDQIISMSTGDKLIIVKYHGRLVNWEDRIEANKFFYYLCEVL